MNIQELVHTWFDLWKTGDFESLPLTEDFTHTSPYGTIRSKAEYFALAAANRDAFLGNTFEIHEMLFDAHKACIRYTMRSPTGTLEVSEWIYEKNGLIAEIIAYYNLEEEREAGRSIEIKSDS